MVQLTVPPSLSVNGWSKGGGLALHTRRRSWLAPGLALLIVMTLVGVMSGDGVVAQSPCAPGAGGAGTPAAPTPSTELGWETRAAMTRPRSELGAAVAGGIIYVVGGFGGPAAVDCFDPRSGTWAAVADLPVGVHHPGVAALDGVVYVAGGYAEDGATDALWAYDPAVDAWQERAPMPTARGALGLVALDGRLYAVGGARQRLGGPVTGAVEAYDPATDTWELRAAMPTPREHLVVAAGAGRVFAVGGRADGDEGDRFAAANEAYDPSTDQWETLPPLPTPRGGFAGAFAGERLVVAGGERGPRSYDEVDAYDPATQTWEALPPMPTARHGLAVVAIGDTVYVIGGSTRARAAESTGANESIMLRT